MDSWTASVASQVAVGRGWAVCSPHSSSLCEIHISWRELRGLFPSVLGLAGEKASGSERPVWGWEPEGPTAKACSASSGNSCPGGAGGSLLPSSSQITHFVARLLMMQLSSSGKHLF
jgi:hypothetical protein